MKKRIPKETLDAYRAMLPSGTQKIVAAKAGVSIASLNNFFNGRNDSWKIEKAILCVVAELRDEREELLKKAGFKSSAL